MSPRDRDEYAPKHPRPATAPTHIEPETSEAISDPAARKAWRAQQDEDKRIEKLEDKHDALKDDHQALEVKVAKMDGKLDVLVTSALASDDERKARRQREIDDAMALERARVRRAALWRQFLKIVVPLVTAVGTIYGTYRWTR